MQNYFSFLSQMNTHGSKNYFSVNSFKRKEIMVMLKNIRDLDKVMNQRWNKDYQGLEKSVLFVFLSTGTKTLETWEVITVHLEDIQKNGGLDYGKGL